MKDITILTEGDSSKIENFSKGYLNIPFDGPDFKQFITNLLGKPQQINKKISGSFKFELADLQNVYHLLNQRITQQNNGALLQFTVTIYYNDDSNVVLNSFNELQTYNETKSIISEAVRLNWSYLIHFTGKEVPEKQEIDILLISCIDDSSHYLEDLPFFLIPDSGKINIEIRHTARTFAVDIENLLSNHFENIKIPQNKLRIKIKKHSKYIGVIITIMLFLISLITCFYISQQNIQKKIIESQNLDSNISIKVNYIINELVNGEYQANSLMFTMFLSASLIISIFTGIYISTKASRLKEYSYIILTKKSLEYYEKTNSNQKKFNRDFIISIIISIVCGIIGNFIFMYLTSK